MLESLGERLRRYRLRSGLTQRELAERAGVSLRALRDMERDRVRAPHERSVRRLAAALSLTGTDLGRLLRARGGEPEPATEGALVIGVLGPLSVRRAGVALALSSPRQRWLLGLLSLHAGRSVSVEEIVDVLWDERPPRTCVDLVHGHVRQLRRVLEPLRPPGAAAAVVVRGHGGYRLELPSEHLDAARFAELLGDAGRARSAGDLADARRLLSDALGMWRGPVLADAGHHLRRHVCAVALGRQRVAAALTHADLAMELGRPEAAATPLAAVVADEPLHEGLHARLMLALAGDGEQAAALGLFAEVRARLRQELGVEPGPELQAAHLRVLRQEIRPPHRGPAPLAPAVAVPAQLPVDLDGFAGRADELAQLDALAPATAAHPAAVAITVLCGTAGVGKTALAVHWAHRTAHRFPDGQLFVNLHGHAPGPALSSQQALGHLLRALGIQPDRVPLEPQDAAGLYRSLLSGRRVLVVLDNALDAQQVRPLLPSAPGCVAVVTSRDRLGGLVATHGARRLRLGVLRSGEAVALLGQIIGGERVAAEPRAAAELVRLCGALPLAVRIAAANLGCQPEEPIAGYVARLGDGGVLDALEVDGDPAAAVRAAFELSYRPLGRDARRLFRLLGLVPGAEVSAGAAAALAGATVEQARRLLERLAGAHLLEQRGPGRFAFHDLLRLYARERAREEEGEAGSSAALGRLLAWYLHGATTAAEVLYPQMLRLPAPPAAGGPMVELDGHEGALAWLDAERANLVAAVVAAAEQGLRPAAWLLADALRSYFWESRHMLDWRAVGQAALAAAAGDGDRRAQAAAHLSLGDAELSAAAHGAADRHYASALALARQSGWVAALATTQAKLGMLHWDAGRLEQAADHFTRALALHRNRGNPGGQASALANLGNVERELGRLRQAAQHHAQALVLYREVDSRGGEAATLVGLGELDHDLGSLARATARLTDTLALCREVGNRYSEAYALNVLAAVRRDSGSAAEALRLGHAALTLALDIGDRRIQAEAHSVLGSVYLELGDPAEALAWQERAVGVARDIGTPYPEAIALVGLAGARQRLGHHDQATEDAEQALAIACQAGYLVLRAQAQTALAAVLLARGRHDRAVEHARQAVALQRHSGHRLGEARALVVLGHGRSSHAGRLWREALEIFVEAGAHEADSVRHLLGVR